MNLPRCPSFRLDGRRALVTGASSGIGLACAAALAGAGAHVVCAARSVEKLKTVVKAIEAADGSAEVLPMDVAELEDLTAKLNRQAPFDIAVNSAGLARHGPALDTRPEDYDAVMTVNLRAAYFLSVSVAKGLIEARKPGSIIHISSQMAHVGGIDRALYCASKHGLEGMIKAMAIEWGPQRIRINSICPTFIRTALTESTFANPGRRKWIEEKVKLGRVGEVEDIMGAVIYLASDASSLVTGTSLLVDGGWTAD